VLPILEPTQKSSAINQLNLKVFLTIRQAKNDKSIYLGLYKTPELAYEAYCKKAKELFGDFSHL